MKPIGGMFLDCAPADQPQGTYRRALNIVLNRLKGAVAVEGGTAFEFTGPANMVPVASVLIDASNIAVLFAKSDSTAGMDIGVFNETTGVYTQKYHSLTRELSLDHPIKIIAYRNYRNDRIIVWTDGIYKPSIYNIDTPFTDESMMDLFPTAVVPEMAVTVAEGSGNLPAGSYYFAIAYEMADGFLTDYLCISNPIPIFTPELGDNNWRGGGTPGETTNMGVKLTLSDMDLRYTKFRVAVVSYINGVYAARETSAYYLQGSTEVVISDLNNTVDILLEDVTINRANYTKAETLTYENRKLFMGGVAITDFPDYQPYANDIKVRWTSKYTPIDTPVTESFKDGSVCVYDKGFMPGEVYSLYIAWLLNDGSYSQAFHIPGRLKTNLTNGGSAFSEDIRIDVLDNGTYGYSVADLEMDLIVNPNAKYFHTRDGSTVSGEMSYWENEEKYPANFPNSYTGAVLANANIRHHRFPTFAKISTSYGGGHSIPMLAGGGSTALTLGLKLHNVPVPASIAGLVQGFEIFYVKRTYNNSLVSAMTYLMLEGAYLTSPPSTTFPLDPYGYSIVARLFCPDLQKNEEYPAIAADYIRLEEEITIQSPYYSYPIGLPDASLNFLRGADLQKNIMSVNQHEYVPFTPDKYQESGLKVTCDQANSWIYNFQGVNPSEYMMVPITINAFRTNVYTGLFYQQLINTGKQFFTRDSASMDPALVNGVNCLWATVGYSDGIYGGDIYTSRFSHYTNIYASGGTSKQRKHYVMPYWSHSNLGLRVEGTEYGEKFLSMDALGTYPSLTGIDYGTAPSDLLPDAEFKVDNYIKVYDDYSKSNELNMVYPYVYGDNNISSFPNRIISSQPIQAEDTGGSLRKFLPLDYYEMPKNRGPITNLEGYNGMLLIHMEDSLYKTTGKVQLQSDQEAVVIGSGNIFGIEPTEIITIPGGYAGCRHPFAANVSKAGYFFIDERAAKMFILRESMDEVSNVGLRNFFEENLQFQLLKDLRTYLNTWDDQGELYNDNAFSPFGVGYIVTFDDRYLRLIVTKRDFRVVSPGTGSLLDISYKMRGGAICTKSGSSRVTLASLVTAGYLEDNSFTLSYDMVTQKWASFHSYLPTFMCSSKRHFYGAITPINSVAANFYRFNEDYQNGNYMGIAVKPSWIDATFPDKAGQHSITSSISWTSAVLDANGSPDFYRTWDRMLIYNTHQCSGWRSIDSAGTGRNSRFTGGRWHFNDFRDMTSTVGSAPPVNNPVQRDHELLVDISGNPVNIDTGKSWNLRKRFIDTYCIIRLEHTNTNPGIVYLYDLETSGRPVVR